MQNRLEQIEAINQRIENARKVYSVLDNEEFSFEEYVNEFVDMSKKIDYKEGIYSGLILSSLRNMACGSYEKGYEILKDLEKKVVIDELSPRNKMKYYATNFLYYANYKSEYEKAIVYAKLEMKEAESISDLSEVMRLKMNIGSISANLGFYETALPFYNEAVEYCESVNDFRVLMYGYSNLGEVYYKTKDYERGKSFYKKAIKLAKQEEEFVIRYDATLGLAKIHIVEETYEEALELLNEALKYEMALKDKQRKIEIVRQIIKVYTLTNRYEEALAEINKFEYAIDIIENKILVMKFYLEKARICEKLNKFEMAYITMKKYMNLYRAEDNHESEHDINELIQEEYKKSLDWLETIAKVGRELTILTDIDQVLLDVKRVLSKVLKVDSIGIGEIIGNEISYTHFFDGNEKVDIGNKPLDDKRSFATWCINNRKAIVINDFMAEHAQYMEEITLEDSNEIQSLMYAPLIVGDEVMGVFTIQSESKRAYTSVEVKIFNIIADYVAIAVKNASQKSALEELSVRDNLTNMYNRRGFTEFFNNKVKERESLDGFVSIIMLDLDFFKKINDTYGHGAGDIVLTCVGKVLMKKETENIRAARLGGEEFALIIVDEELSLIKSLANSIREEIENFEITIDKSCIKVTTSVGVVYRKYSQSISYDQLYFEADKALYRAKELGRNQVQFYYEESCINE